TLAFFDVSTQAATLNNNVGINSTIFDDLGTGKSYGSFVVARWDPTEFASTITFTLNSNAVDDIALAAGGFFSIGGALQGLNPQSFTFEGLFSGSNFIGIQQLVVITTPVPEPSTYLLFISGAGALAWYMRRK